MVMMRYYTMLNSRNKNCITAIESSRERVAIVEAETAIVTSVSSSKM